MENYHSKLPINQIIQGDCLEILKKFPDECIDMIMFSPPYWSLRRYLPEGHQNEQYQIGLEPVFDCKSNCGKCYMCRMMAVMKEIKRVLKKSGTIFVNYGDIYGGQSAGNKTISKANIGTDGLYVRKMKQTAGAKNFVSDFTKRFGGVGNTALSYRKNQGRALREKSLLGMPWRFALRCIDELGLYLRNDIIWAKQVLFFEKDGTKYTKGSVMPTSVKDRFNQSFEHLFFFTKSKKYYSNLDTVRIPPQTFENHPNGFTRSREFQYDSKYLQDYSPMAKQSGQRFNYRVRDAERKAGQPQFSATKEEITSYIARKYGYNPEEICPVCGRSWKRHASPNASDRKVGLKREFIPCVKRNWRKETEKEYKYINNPDPRGNDKGGPGSFRLWKDKHPYQGKFLGVESPEVYENLKGNILGKNLPTVFQINPEPHNFQKELKVQVDHFAVFPKALCEVPIKFGCPKEVCKKCGKPKMKIIETNNPYGITGRRGRPMMIKGKIDLSKEGTRIEKGYNSSVYYSGKVIGYTDCGCNAKFEPGIVLDPFCGSGTTLIVAKKLGRNYIGIDINPDYCKIAELRLAKVQKSLL